MQAKLWRGGGGEGSKIFSQNIKKNCFYHNCLSKGRFPAPFLMNFWKTSEGGGEVISDPKNFVILKGENYKF